MLPAFLIVLASPLFTSLRLLVFPTGSGIHALVVVALYFSCLVCLEIMLLLQSLLKLSSPLLPTFQASLLFFVGSLLLLTSLTLLKLMMFLTFMLLANVLAVANVPACYRIFDYQTIGLR
jgi:hypothetical protein